MSDMNMSNNETSKTLEELQKYLQEYVDADFICPICQTHNNTMVVDPIQNCNCVSECQVKVARIAGKCNDCNHNFVGVVATQKRSRSKTWDREENREA
jgi:hypothetical protein